jgi:Uma2 family endonuclease
MAITAAQISNKENKIKANTKRYVTLQSFLKRYPNKEDRFKYEWNKGVIEKFPRNMNRDQSLIQENILAFFYANPAFRQLGAFVVELDMYIATSDRTRRADMAFLTRTQMDNSLNGDLSVAPFVIEVILNNDKLNDTETKLQEYFENGVQVVWQILTFTKMVKVYTSLKKVTICLDADICSAAPVLNDFQIPANYIFGKI